MGHSTGVGVIKEVRRSTPFNGVNVDDVRISVGPSVEFYGQVYHAPNSYSVPLAGDFSVWSSGFGSRKYAVGFLCNGVGLDVAPGEHYVFGRSGDGSVVCVVATKNDGTVKVYNDNGSLELKPDGEVVINGIRLTTAGEVIAPGGVTSQGTMVAEGSMIMQGSVTASGDVDVGGSVTASEFILS